MLICPVLSNWQLVEVVLDTEIDKELDNAVRTHTFHVFQPLVCLVCAHFERHPLFTVSHPATESAFSPHSPNLTHTTTPPPRPHAPAEPKAQHIHFASLNLLATIYLT